MWAWWMVVGLAVFLIGVTKSGFGAGVGLMIVPMTVIALKHLPPGAGAALGLMLPLLIVGDVIAVWQYRKLFNQQAIFRLLPGTAVGLVIGGGLLLLFHNQPPRRLTAFIEIEVGLESIILVGLHWYRTWRADSELLFQPHPARSAAVGAFAGASSTLAHAAGPIIALHLLPQRFERQIFVGTCAVYFFIVNTAKVPIYAKAHQFRSDMLQTTMYVVPLVFAGAAFGYWLTRQLNEKMFARGVYAMTFALGWYLAWIGLRAI
jgi:uncharacterized membrane protein YfcA